jgi:hypothetical protein
LEELLRMNAAPVADKTYDEKAMRMYYMPAQ